MKKILIILSLCYSFSFSGVPNETGYIGQDYYYVNDSVGNVGYCVKKTTFSRSFDYDDWVNKGCGSSEICYSSNFFYIYSDWRVDDFNGITYAEGTIYNSSVVANSECVTALNPPPTCTEDETQNADCSCKTGYISNLDDGNHVEGCTRDCDSTIPNINIPDGWESFINVYNFEIDCSNYAANFNSIYSFNTLENTGCTYNICSVLTYKNDDPCQTADPMIFPSPDWIYKGIVNTDAECQAFVLKSYDYLNASTQRVSKDCPTNTKYFCYVLPALDNDDDGLVPPDYNNTNPDGTIPLPNDLENADLNSSIPSPDLDSVSRSNLLLGQLTGDFKAYFEWQKTSNNSYAKSLTEFGRTFLKGLNANNRNNDNSNTNKIVSAINNSKVDLSSIENKLDTLIGSDTSDSSGDTISSLGSITDSLSDFNFTDSLDSNFSKDFTEGELDSFVTTAYDGFDARVISALTTVFDSIDYGVIDLFSVSEYSFQDYHVGPLDIPMTNKKLEGNLLSADFLNGLDFSMGRLAFLLATLLGCVYYIINRLFT